MNILWVHNFQKVLFRSSYVAITLLFILSQSISLLTLLTIRTGEVKAASDVFRSTTYELQTGEFTGTSYTLTLNNNLSADYFTMISGPAAGTSTRAADVDQVRVSADPHSNFGSSTGLNEIELTRGATGTDWIGALTVVECLANCGVSGFRLSEVLETNLSAGSGNSLQSVSQTLSSNYSSNTVPLSGRFGGGLSTSSSDANVYAVTLGAKVTKQNSNEINFDRYGAENRVPAAATFVTYLIEWGSEWTVQNANVTGTAAGVGVDAITEYDTASIASVSRDNTWVWGSGFTRNDGLGDGALGQVVTLGDGVNQNISETQVAVGGDLALTSPGRDFQVYTMTHAVLEVDHRFKVRGDAGATSGFQELDLTVDSALNTEDYDNVATDVQYTEGYRAPIFYNTSAGTGQAYSRTGAWGLRINGDTNLNYWRAYSGQVVAGWAQVMDFGEISFSNVDTRQQIFRWRDDSTAVDTDGGWLASENTNLSDQAKGTPLRLRIRSANHGTTAEDNGRTYELQYTDKGTAGSCDLASGWSGVGDSSTDAFEMVDSSYISTDGQIVTNSLLSDPDGFGFVSGQAREVADTTSAIGPLNSNSYTEIEYSISPTDDAVTGSNYCFRLYDTAANSLLDRYDAYPEISIESTVTSSKGLGEAGTFSSATDGGWTTINFLGSYASPVVVGTTNSHNGQSALVFESRNVTGTSAEMRVCESEGSTSNGCDTHASETVGYMVIDADIAAVTEGIEAGTFTANGEADVNSVTTNYSGTFSTTPYVFANVNTVNSGESPTEVVITSTSATDFLAGICDHLQGSADNCDGTHVNETVGWVAIEPGNEPFSEQHDSGVENIGASTWTPITFSPSFASAPVLIVSSQEDTGGQDVEIDEARSVTTSGGDIRFCEIDTLDNCDSHNADDVAWFAIESGEFVRDIALDLDGFRFYENSNSVTPTVPLGSENSSIAAVDDGDLLRIRTGVQSASQINSGAFDLKLQYGETSSNCSAVGAWADVGSPGSGEKWRGYDNATPADGASIPSSLLDGGTNITQNYEESSPSATSSAIPIGSRGEWDWVLQNNNADDFTTYCFRLVFSDNSLINYSAYPTLTTSTGVANLAPNAPVNLAQEKTSTTGIATGEVINETTVVFEADISDQNESDIVQLCVEVVEVGSAFTNTETACGVSETYAAPSFTCVGTGDAFYQKYDGISGTAIGDLYADPDYPNNPSSTQTITTGPLQTPINIDDDFGGKLSGLICPPQDGDYTFWVSGDDGTELLLSTDDNPANASVIADVPGWSPVNDWTKYPGNQDSAPITLSAGNYYYIEANYKEAAGGDHAQIGWTLPDLTVDRPISDTYYSLPSETTAGITDPGVTPTVTVSVSGFENDKQYHWQVRSKDASGAYSSWVSYGANSESESDFSIDTVAPDLAVYDGTNPGADIEFNGGELDELSANWEKLDGESPDSLAGLTLWLDGQDVENDGTDPTDGASVNNWVDKSGRSNDISGTGVATFDAARQAIAFNSSVRPFDDTYDRSGGDSGAISVFSVVTGNGSTSNHVWYETTTPRVSPAEDGILGGGTSLSSNNNWSNHITDTKIITLDYNSGGTSTAWLDRTQEHQFSETQSFADSQRITIGDDTTGGNELEAGEFVHEIIVFNENMSLSDREELWEYLECKWAMKDCSVTYEYAIGTSPGGTDIKGWTSESGTSITASGLALETSNVYFVSVRATDAAGNQVLKSSDGQLVAPTISFSTSTTGVGVQFDRLNQSNNFTDTKDTILTTSTNAKNGYNIRAYATGTLENALLDTIDGFDGGTYASPDTWEPGDTGWGYTSSDTLVGGVNKFNSATCPGGGTGGPCFSPFSTAPIGDIVADNPGPVVGTPINNEQFTITHRVTASPEQPDGTYLTTLIFQATANY